jgi:hypothetical protein
MEGAHRIASAYVVNALKIRARTLEEIQLRRNSICIDSPQSILHGGNNSDWRTLRVCMGQRKMNAGANQANEAADARRSCVQAAARAVLCFAR